ncbi:UDP-N-acetylmuramoyl-tripeptide--D-alanyl-D-alanine ligase [Actinoplanes sp. N902-109]|uniref:UDP-N-acetylmuramoyl-tripeptide--D-alanyl-D- alanine ligase n=1 Tax=Actinoplanes sp. (strain N902-109) TaxID=649831 RepID=UPI00032965D2|nr:UDP-N-acetylmuramoyl-tripeptide--D-alanyl-D-alanine ligase [Actinoplanes sp. N902-109]AGL15525.1 UDP-N-acetylmuramoylalanyl-D-glutamyl-2, 6-diaminopimelate/D-alanyl-D-alanyl ligase [Actinoplanes sp. N902-109]
MIALTLAEIAAITGGQVVGADSAAGAAITVDGPVEYDSRAPMPGGLFVAFEGEKVDGHDFAAAAVARGAAAVLGTRETGRPGVVVKDQLEALGKLAHEVVGRLPGLTVVGLTGSSGKTTTKDYIGQLLARLGDTVAPAGSPNNELGFPCTVLKAGPDTRYLVLEMGARGIGHIAYLTGIAAPRIGLVLNIGAAHIGEFGSMEGTARAKGELVESLPADGVALLNADDPLVAAMAARTRARVVTFGEDPGASVRAEQVTLDGRGRAAYTLVTEAGRAPVQLRVTGRHQVSNTLAAAAVALECGLPVADVAAALAEVGVRSSRRMDVVERADGVTLIDDSYNANPSSTAAALRALAAMGERGRTIAVLGYMAELGDQEVAGHEEVGRLAAELGVHRLVAVAEAQPVLDGARAVPEWTGEPIAAGDQAAAIAAVTGDLRPGDVVLVKGSRYRTWEVADALRAGAAAGEVSP